MKKQTSYMQRTQDVKRQWQLVDVKGQVLGRVATQIATMLTGKNKTTYTPHVDGGDYVVVINAAQVELTRNKEEKKLYRWHTGFPGGLREMLFSDMMKRDPSRVIQKAVYNMLPKNRLRNQRMTRLKIFVADQHPYQDQLTVSQSK